MTECVYFRLPFQWPGMLLQFIEAELKKRMWKIHNPSNDDLIESFYFLKSDRWNIVDLMALKKFQIPINYIFHNFFRPIVKNFCWQNILLNTIIIFKKVNYFSMLLFKLQAIFFLTSSMLNFLETHEIYIT